MGSTDFYKRGVPTCDVWFVKREREREREREKLDNTFEYRLNTKWRLVSNC